MTNIKFFLHIPKTGGQSISALPGVMSTLASNIHIPANAVEIPTRFFTVVRNPIDRIYSHFRFSKYDDFDVFLEDLQNPIDLQAKRNCKIRSRRQTLSPISKVRENRKIVGDAIRERLLDNPDYNIENFFDENPLQLSRSVLSEFRFTTRKPFIEVRQPVPFSANTIPASFGEARGNFFGNLPEGVFLQTLRGRVAVPGHVVPNQWDYIENDKMHDIRIFEFDRQRDMLLDYLGVDELPRINSGTYSPEQKQADLTPERIALIKQICYKDYEQFEFDENPTY